MVMSPPGSPAGATRSRPQSIVFTGRQRSNSRVSKQGGSGVSDEDRTSIKVAIRIRPPLQPADPGWELIPQRFQRSMVSTSSPNSLDVDAPQGRKRFVFDHVFGPDNSQSQVWEHLQETIDGAIAGYNAAVLCYGQSGAGKSYTMGTSGPTEQNDPQLKGIIPRAASYLFEQLNGSHSRGLRPPSSYPLASTNGASTSDRKWKMTATYVEIYNETLRDLLLPDPTPLIERTPLAIREDPKGKIIVTGLREIEVKTVDQLLSALNHGSEIRQTDATTINDKSSRSHAIFTLNLVQQKSHAALMSTKEKRRSIPYESTVSGEPGVVLDSKIHFTDLAGSERLKNTNATGERAREGISINSGLANLGKCISQLSARQTGSHGHVSYRDSKLTRILQNSLGGDALTFMIASVNPSEFYLQETLNTLQYATRMRLIKISPVVQQVDEEGDRQALIDRLKAEVSWLRQQLRTTEGADKKNSSHQERSDRSDRPNERERELQNQLMDFQESYNALSQRHAKTISELARTGEGNDDLAVQSPTESSIERLQRSRANQEQIENMVLEYETTIQTLESNLSNTRASLAVTEGSLLEKESRCVHTETVNQHLHARMQKLVDRESNTERYMKELEGRLDGHSSGEEKNGAMIAELRKEITRMRESESNSEDYISTLEERLAEADSDMDQVQREVSRLEAVVDRQRSIGKLDNLLFELDHARSNEVRPRDAAAPDQSTADVKQEIGLSKNDALHTLEEAKETALSDEVDDDLVESSETNADLVPLEEDDQDSKSLARVSQMFHVDAEPSPAQAKHMAEKFESVSGELFDLRIEHETTTNELTLMTAKYQEALRRLAVMADEDRQSTHDSSASIEVTSRPESIASDGEEPSSAARKAALSSRSPSSDLPTPDDNSSVDDADTTETSRDGKSPDVASAHVRKLKQALVEHEGNMSIVTEKYAQLKVEHQQALEMVDDLKAEVKRKSLAPPSPLSPVIRRGTSQNLIVDRANRPLASLRALMAEELDGRSNKLEAAEVHFSAASHELQSRIERIQALEGEIKNVKKEMDAKTTIIHGLTRERNSLKGSSPVDLSMVTQMRDRLIENETQMKSLHESHASREEELLAKVKSLESSHKRGIIELPAGDASVQNKTTKLEREVFDWKTKHETAVESLQVSEKRLLTTTAELEATMASVEAIKAQLAADSRDEVDREAASMALQIERDKHTDLIDSLKRNIDDQKSQAARLTQRNSSMRQLVAQHERDLSTKEEQLASHEAKLRQMEKSSDDHRIAVEQHKQGLKTLHETHQTRVEEMKLAHAGQLAEMDDQLAELKREQPPPAEGAEKSARNSVGELPALLTRVGAVLGHATSAEMLHSHIQDLKEEKMHATEVHSRLTKANAELEKTLEHYRESKPELSDSGDTISEFQARIRALAEEVANHEESIRAKDEMIRKRDATIENINVEKKNNARIIEELEQQIETSFDHHHNRLSVMQQQGSHALVESQARIAALERELETQRGGSDVDLSSRTNTMKSHRPQSPLTENQNRTSSLTNLRKSASAASLPSPPPAIPLPPLPVLPSMASVNGLQAPNASSSSPPGSRHASKEIPATSSHQTQVIEEQETRIRTVEKHLNAEKQLTATLEEALVDLETQSNKLRQEMENWKKKAWNADEELTSLRRDKKTARESIQAVELERDRRREAEAARAQLEERMNQLSRKKKKNALNCF